MNILLNINEAEYLFHMIFTKLLWLMNYGFYKWLKFLKYLKKLANQWLE